MKKNAIGKFLKFNFFKKNLRKLRNYTSSILFFALLLQVYSITVLMRFPKSYLIEEKMNEISQHT